MPLLTTTEIIERLKDVLNVKSDGEVADFLRIKRPALSMKKIRNSSIVDDVLHLAQRMELDLNQILIKDSKAFPVFFRDESGNKTNEIHLSRAFLEARGLDPESLIVINQEGQLFDNLHLVDTRVTRINSDGIYAIATENNVLLKQATIRLDGSILFPSRIPEIPAENIDKSSAKTLHVVGRTVLMLAPPD
jgi:hypothetical protein